MEKLTFISVMIITLITAASCGSEVQPISNRTMAKAKLQPAFYGTVTNTWIKDMEYPVIVREVDPLVEPGDLVHVDGKNCIVLTIDRAPRLALLNVDYDSAFKHFYFNVQDYDGEGYEGMTAHEVDSMYGLKVTVCQDFKDHIK